MINIPVYRFDHWDIDGVVYTANPLQINISANTVITAVYVAVQYRIAYQSSPVQVPLFIDGQTVQSGGTVDLVGGPRTISVPMEVTV